MKTLDFYKTGNEEIKKGGRYYFGQLWDGNGDGLDLLESGSVAIAETVIEFEIAENNADPLETVVTVTDMF